MRGEVELEFGSEFGAKRKIATGSSSAFCSLLMARSKKLSSFGEHAREKRTTGKGSPL